MGQEKNSESDSALSQRESQNVLKKADIMLQGVLAAKPHKCTFDGCNEAFARPSRLARHMRFHNGERIFKCDYAECDKAYTNACHLKRHQDTHNPTKKLYKCLKCSLYISSQPNLRRHYNTVHKENKKFTCTVCNESFTKKYQLAVHMGTHSPVVYKCDQCDKSFICFTQYRRHKARHKQGNKQYPCTMAGCTEVFEKWLLFRAHLKTQHVSEHRCKECNKIFLSKNHLKVHSQVHLENRSVIPCPVEKCPRVYYFKRNLDHHIRTYHLAQKYECDICKVKIGTKQKLVEHIQKLHMTENRVKKIKKVQRKRRKDAGIPKRSVVSKLIGVILPARVEQLVLERKQTIEYIESFETESNDKPDS